MAAIEAALSRARLTPEHIPAALQLSIEVGWNQTADDWALFIERGHALGTFCDGSLIATAATILYGRLRYVAMVIVAAAYRHRGIASGMLREVVAGRGAGDPIAVLDATPAGAGVYRDMGFAELCRFRRWQGRAGGAVSEVLSPAKAPTQLNEIRSGTCDDVARLAALDEAAFGAPRHYLLDNFLSRRGTQALTAQDAFVIRRHGVRADQIGPLVAPDTGVAADLLRAALALRPGPVFIDLFDRFDGLGAILGSLGFSVQRPFTRMSLGGHAPAGDPARLFLAAGPEFG
jgi:hypothetical protein